MSETSTSQHHPERSEFGTTSETPTAPPERALEWLLHESDAAQELRRRVWTLTARIEVEGTTEYLDEELQIAEETLVTVHSSHRGWEAAAARAWNSLPAFDRQVLCLRHLAHRKGQGDRAAHWWSNLVLTEERGYLIGLLGSATAKFDAIFCSETHRRAV